jgi:hypothetical protein
VGGTFRLDAYANGTGFIYFFSMADFGTLTITSVSETLDSNGRASSLTATFNGTTADGDNGAYTGIATFTFIWNYYSDGGGRGGGGAGWRPIITGGQFLINC